MPGGGGAEHGLPGLLIRVRVLHGCSEPRLVRKGWSGFAVFIRIESLMEQTLVRLSCSDCGNPFEAKSPQAKRCPGCKRKKKNVDWIRCRRNNPKAVAWQQAYMKEYRAELRLAALKAYSPDGMPRCACKNCPEHKNPHVGFLEVDHIDGDGSEHRREQVKCSMALLTWLRRHNYPPGYQILCANCNRHKGGTPASEWRCPHEDVSSEEIGLV